jgi:uncharacterized protein YeaO (DUF488 family)
VIWTPDLAPSLSLFSAYRTKKIISWPEYERRFREELESQKKKEKMRELWSKLKQGKNICLVCFCPKSDRCHRRIVGEYLAKYGAKVEEQLSRQASLF